MAHTDAFALQNSGFNPFLFAEVGSELNGSQLTILSVLARLGKDPWNEAARLAQLPKSATIDDLANSISQMPLGPQALTDARSTAARLILLLPEQVHLLSKRATPAVGTSAIPRWIPLAIVLLTLVCAIAFQMFPTTGQTGSAAPSAVQTTDQPH